MNIVFNFKNQVSFRGDNITDLKMLKISIKQWLKYYKPGFKDVFICGHYNKEELDELISSLGSSFINDNKLKIVNIEFIPSIFKTSKTNIVNYQMMAMWSYTKEPFIMGTNDIFPINLTDDTYLNKEYSIRHKDYRELNIPDLNKAPWFLVNWINTIEYFKYKYNFFNKEIYEGHNAYVVTKEFMDFYMKDPELWINKDRDVVLSLWLKMNGHDLMHEEEFCKPIFANNKLQISNDDIKRLKMINATLPNHPKSKKILKRIIK